jgi:DNA-binding transcriptional MerR regulator
MTGVSRRAVQGYEKEGLISACGKNLYGYLLYDEATQHRVSLIKMYQNFGFKVKDIKTLIDAPNQVIREALIAQLSVLEQNRDQLNAHIREIQELINQLS